jgi:hypothetical protein
MRDTFGGWWYSLLYEETCYDRARRLPSHAHANSWNIRYFEEQILMRPAV